MNQPPNHPTTQPPNHPTTQPPNHPVNHPTTQPPNHLLFLIGPRGSGKSTVARLLAHELGWDALDADEVLEKRCGQSIRSLFAAEGETGFRDREADVLAELCHLQRHVIATGGGVVLREGNRELLRASGGVVWLTADIETLWQRLRGDNTSAERRPPLLPPPQGGEGGGGGGREEIVEIMRIREPLYRMCADFIVETAGRSPAEIVREILRGASGLPLGECLS